MFFNRIYDSWKKVQMEKYEVIYGMIKKHGIKLGLSLDVGCGPFYLQEFFKEKDDYVNFICIDVDKELRSINTNKYKFLFADGNMLPFKEESFDTVFIIDSTHFIRNFSGINRVLKLNGHLFATTFVNEYNIITKRRELEKKLENFEIIDEAISNGTEKELIFLAKKMRR